MKTYYFEYTSLYSCHCHSEFRILLAASEVKPSFTWLETDPISVRLYNRWRFSHSLRCQQELSLHLSEHQTQIKTHFLIALIFWNFTSTHIKKFLLAPALWIYHLTDLVACSTSACLLLYLCTYMTATQFLLRAQTKSSKYGANKILLDSLYLSCSLFWLSVHTVQTGAHTTPPQITATYFQKSM